MGKADIEEEEKETVWAFTSKGWWLSLLVWNSCKKKKKKGRLNFFKGKNYRDEQLQKIDGYNHRNICRKIYGLQVNSSSELEFS